MLGKFDSPEDFRSGKHFLIIGLLAAQAYIALLDIRFGGSIFLETMFVIPVILSALLLKRYQAILFSICSSALYTYSFSRAGDQSTTITLFLNFLIAGYAYALIGELFRLAPKR
jgi:hypothetical protein